MLDKLIYFDEDASDGCERNLFVLPTLKYTLKYREDGIFDFYAPSQADKLPVISLRVTRREAEIAVSALSSGRNIPDYLLPRIVAKK